MASNALTLCTLCASVVLLCPVTARAATLTVFAAASLTDAFRGIGAAYERAHPGTRVTFDFAASSLLRVQIEQGAPADVFASADRAQMAPLDRMGLVKGVLPLARNQLVVILPAGNPGHIQHLADLAWGGVRLAITAPQVPVGLYTRQALDKMSAPGAMGAGFQQRVLANVVSQEPNVRGLVAKVELGEADAAIVYRSDAVAAGRKVKTLAIPERFNETAVYPVAVVTGSPHSREAGSFVQYLRLRPAQAILLRYGFQPAVP